MVAATEHARSGADAPPLFEPGEVVSGSYVIRGMLGRGGMGQVFGADDLFLLRSVAIKSMPLVGENAGGLLLRREAQALAQVRHPGVVAVHGMGAHRGLPYIVMERLYGISLADHLLARRAVDQPFTIGEALDLLVATADALAAIHEAGMAHRDLKPGNVMLCGSKRVALLDLGIVMPEVNVRPTIMCGTPLYMAPELIEQNVEPGQAHLVDTYAFGVMAYEVLTGAPPFDEHDLVALLERQMCTSPPDVRDARADVPARLAAIVRDCLAKEPGDRPPRMDAVCWDLRAIRNAWLPHGRVARYVLIVDDDPDAVELMRACVRAVTEGLEVRAVGRAEDALEMLRRDPASLALVDLALPGINGLDFCAQLCGMHALERCPVVVVTAADDDRTRLELQRLGVPRVVVKGADLPRRLTAVVRALVPTSAARTSRPRRCSPP
jgi:serine/threonine-protein kinase